MRYVEQSFFTEVCGRKGGRVVAAKELRAEQGKSRVEGWRGNQG